MSRCPTFQRYWSYGFYALVTNGESTNVDTYLNGGLVHSIDVFVSTHNLSTKAFSRNLDMEFRLAHGVAVTMASPKICVEE